MDDPLTRRRRMPKTVAVTNGDDNPVKRSRHRRRRKRSQEAPFWLLVLQVGATIFIVSSFTFSLLRYVRPEDEEYRDDEQYVVVVDESEEEIETAKPKKTDPPLPEWKLGEASRFDAYGLAERHAIEQTDDFWRVALTMRKDFAERYGNENAARAILERALSTFGGEKHLDLERTACRIREAKEQRRPFKFAFGGYSVTVGRGNFFRQSFPFVMERILKRPFRALGVDLQVKNHAIGGIPSFPYGWCMENFWGRDADVVSWDYSMNEAGGVPEGLEAYVRHTMMLDRSPKLIVKDTHMAEARRDVLQT